MEVVRLDVDDVYNLMAYCEPYAYESGLSEFCTYCPETAYKTFYIALSNKDTFYAYAVKENNKYLGVAIVVIDDSFFKGMEGDIDFFFVRKEDRGTGSSRLLVKACVDLANELELNVLYGGCASFLGEKNNKLYTNLYGKFGFEVTGSIIHYVRS